MNSSLNLFGFASGIAANNTDCALGPWYLYYHPELFSALAIHVHWQAMIQTTSEARQREALPLVQDNLEKLGQAILPFAKKSKPFCVIGGDHSSAIGTWSAVAHANRTKGDIGLIWIDAHMDSHTPDTSLSQNIHGMPVAHLLGEGIPSLCEMFDCYPKIKPENLCVIGVRSYEPAEAVILSRLGVKIFFMDEIKQRGLQAVLKEACTLVSSATCGFGISLDMDAIDPTDAPGVGCPELNGIDGATLVSALHSIKHTPSLLGLELTEFNPIRDQGGKTAQLLVNLIHAVYGNT